MTKNHSKEGFTLIELSLAMVFISLLSLAIVLIITNTISSYRKGLTMNLVNSVGSQIVDDIRLAIQNSSTNSVKNECNARYENETDRKRCSDDGGAYLTSIVKEGGMKVSKEDTQKTVPIYGAICTGSYSYIWNSGYMFSKDTPSEYKKFARLKIDDNIYPKQFKMLKVRDEHRKICASQISSGYPAGNTSPSVGDTFTITAAEVGSEEPAEIIDLNSDLALFNLTLRAPAEAGNGASLFYSGSFILGTSRGGPDILTTNGNCKKDTAAEDFNYCAINKFNFAAQAGGE